MLISFSSNNLWLTILPTPLIVRGLFVIRKIPKTLVFILVGFNRKNKLSSAKCERAFADSKYHTDSFYKIITNEGVT